LRTGADENKQQNSKWVKFKFHRRWILDHLKGKTHLAALENQFKVREICILKQSYKYSKKQGLIA